MPNAEDNSENGNFKLIKDQINVIDAMELQFNVSKQMLFFARGAVGAKKIHVMRKIKKMMEREGKKFYSFYQLEYHML